MYILASKQCAKTKIWVKNIAVPIQFLGCVVMDFKTMSDMMANSRPEGFLLIVDKLCLGHGGAN